MLRAGLRVGARSHGHCRQWCIKVILVLVLITERAVKSGLSPARSRAVGSLPELMLRAMEKNPGSVGGWIDRLP